MSFSETIFLFFLALIIFGPKKLPEIARTVGKYLNEFKRASNEFKAQIEQEIAHLEVESKPTIVPPRSAPEGTASRTLQAASTESAPAPTPVAPADSATNSAADSQDEPLFATEATTPETTTEATTEPAAGSPVASTSQESHA